MPTYNDIPLRVYTCAHEDDAIHAWASAFFSFRLGSMRGLGVGTSKDVRSPRLFCVPKLTKSLTRLLGNQDTTDLSLCQDSELQPKPEK